MQIWDLETSKVSQEIKVAEVMKDENKECAAMKRDPHDEKMIAMNVDEHICLIDVRKEAKSADVSFIAHYD